MGDGWIVMAVLSAQLDSFTIHKWEFICSLYDHILFQQQQMKEKTTSPCNWTDIQPISGALTGCVIADETCKWPQSGKLHREQVPLQGHICIHRGLMGEVKLMTWDGNRLFWIVRLFNSVPIKSFHNYHHSCQVSMFVLISWYWSSVVNHHIFFF